MFFLGPKSLNYPRVCDEQNFQHYPSTALRNTANSKRNIFIAYVLEFSKEGKACFSDSGNGEFG